MIQVERKGPSGIEVHARGVLQAVVETNERTITGDSLFTRVGNFSGREIRGAMTVTALNLLFLDQSQALGRFSDPKIAEVREEIDLWHELAVQLHQTPDYPTNNLPLLEMRMDQLPDLEGDLRTRNLAAFGYHSEVFPNGGFLYKALDDKKYAKLSVYRETVRLEVGHGERVAQMPFRDPDGLPSQDILYSDNQTHLWLANNNHLSIEEYRSLFRGLKWICANILNWQEADFILPEHNI